MNRLTVVLIALITVVLSALLTSVGVFIYTNKDEVVTEAIYTEKQIELREKNGKNLETFNIK